MKVFWRRIHLYLALAAGLIISITCLTGAILVFEKDLQMAFNKDRYFVQALENRLNEDSIILFAQSHLPQAQVRSIKLYRDVYRSAEIGVSHKVKGEKEAKRLTIFINPYTGKVLEVYNHRESFWYWVMDVHRWMLAGDTGKMIVGVCTIIFLIILITGIILWFPKSNKLLLQRLRIKSNAGFKRLNHDFHIVFGFYTAVFLFILAFTGLAWSFEWFNKGIYMVTGTKMEKPRKPENKANGIGHLTGMESVYRSLQQSFPDVDYYTITLPAKNGEALQVTMLPSDAAHESATTQVVIDAVDGAILETKTFAQRNKGQQVRSAFKPIHTASIFGWPSKIIGFVVCLAGFLFPLSGYYMWYNRWFKPWRQSKRKQKLSEKMELA